MYSIDYKLYKKDDGFHLLVLFWTIKTRKQPTFPVVHSLPDRIAIVKFRTVCEPSTPFQATIVIGNKATANFLSSRQKNI